MFFKHGLRVQNICLDKKISKNALFVIRKLVALNHEAYIVGGGVRDLMISKSPKDFDISTDATPHAVRKIFKNSRTIGRRFRLIHVYFENEIIEVSTFRANVQQATESYQCDDHKNYFKIKPDNNYGTIEEDAWRRDFTINSLYYNPQKSQVLDYTNGLSDLKHRTIRIIGNPEQRFHEDPARLIRAIRLMAKIDFKLHTSTKLAVYTLKHLICHVSKSRLKDEFLKSLFNGYSIQVFELFVKFGYLEVFFPFYKQMSSNTKKLQNKLLTILFKKTDVRFSQGHFLSEAHLLASIFWAELDAKTNEIDKFNKIKIENAIDTLLNSVIFLITKKTRYIIKQILLLQFVLDKKIHACPIHISRNKYVKSALHLMELRMLCENTKLENYEFWKKLIY